MRNKTHKQQRKSSADALLKTKTRDIELTEKELGQVTGGDTLIVTKQIDDKHGTKGGNDSGGWPIMYPIVTKV
jgi:hypothetical protein